MPGVLRPSGRRAKRCAEKPRHSHRRDDTGRRGGTISTTPGTGQGGADEAPGARARRALAESGIRLEVDDAERVGRWAVALATLARSRVDGEIGHASELAFGELAATKAAAVSALAFAGVRPGGPSVLASASHSLAERWSDLAARLRAAATRVEPPRAGADGSAAHGADGGAPARPTATGQPGSVDLDVRRARADAPSAPGPYLVELATDHDPEVRRAVGDNPAAVAETLTLLASDADREVRMSVGRSRRGPEAALLELVRTGDERIRQVVAEAEHATYAVLVHLVDDPDPAIRTRVALNPGVTAALLERLASDTDVGVRTASAAHPSTPPGTLDRLAHDSDGIVRRAVALNVHASEATLAALASDPVDWVRSAVAGRADLTPAVATVLLLERPDIELAPEVLGRLGVRDEAAR